MYRSTKGASKARRDQINAEIRSLKDLLPISDADKTRLSYLHIMSLACIYTRKSVFFSQATEGPRITGNSLSFPELSELLHTLPGFLLVLTSEGKLLYLSDNVTEHLGHTMVDLVSQSDSVYDIIEPADHFVVRGNLVPITTPDTDRLFRCRFSTSKFARRQGSGNKLALVRARCLSPPHASSYWTSNPVWVCFCSPLECNVPHVSSARNPLPTPPAEHSFLLACFQSQHGRDMTIHTVQDSVTLYLGYNTETLKLRSWYSLIHPRDLAHASAQHCALLHEGGEKQVEMVVQVEAADHSWVWLYIVLQLETGEFPIICQNYLISESEAWSVRQQLYSDQNQLALLYQEKAQCSDPLSSPDQVFTPSSSGLSTQSFDFSFTLSGRSSSEEQPPSSITIGPESFPSLSQDDERHSQQPSSHQMWLSESQEPASGSNNNSAYSTLSHAHVPVLPSFKALMRQSSEDFIYTPPYTPRTARKRFLFGDEPYKSEQSKARKIRRSMISTNGPPSVEVSVGSAQHCSKRLYETLPPTPDSPGSDECIMMALPEITGPLFVDVPHFSFHPPEGLLTPEASPKKPRLDFFPQGQTSEQEQMEISLLAQYISSLADGFCHNHPQGRSSPSSDAPHPASPQSPTTTLEGSNSSLAHIDVFMFEEKSFDDIPLPNQSTEPPSPYSSCTYTTPAPTSCYTHEEVTTNLCSVQPARFNCVASVEQEVEKPEETFTEDVSAFSGPITSQAFPALAPALPCAQSLLEELATMEPVFGASASMNHAKRQQDELHQLPPQDRQQIFYQDGTSDHMF